MKEKNIFISYIDVSIWRMILLRLFLLFSRGGAFHLNAIAIVSNQKTITFT